MAYHILRLPQVKYQTGLSRSTLYLRIDAGTFPKQIDLGGGRAVGWPDYEVDAINAARIAGWSDDEIRTLVKELFYARKKVGQDLHIAASRMGGLIMGRTDNKKRPLVQ